MVALRKESVDRNLLPLVLISLRIGSLSVRRAWIEMSYMSMAALRQAVALRKESVDRNPCRSFLLRGLLLSLSVRRAWIEIFCVLYH